MTTSSPKVIKRVDRVKQSPKERKKNLKDDKVIITAPEWVKEALKELSKKLEGATFEVDGKKITIDSKNPLTLPLLSAIARNEHANVSGVIDFKLYPGIDREVVIALRDLVKHTVIVGQDKIVAKGGYPKKLGEAKKLKKTENLYVCDLPGIQFQDPTNTGRHVLISQSEVPKGLLDETIFQNTVGEKKATFDQAKSDKQRYVEGTFLGKTVLFDTKAYQSFVANDFVLAATTLNSQASLNNDKINFKFLKYGAGFFADGLDEKLKIQVVDDLTKGVELGLQRLLAMPVEQRSQIKRIDLPFYKAGPPTTSPEALATLERIEKLCKANGIVFSCEPVDMLTETPGLVTATTNCSDPHAPTGNEMNYGSVDAAIAENVENHLDHFNAALNTKMKAEFKPLSVTKAESKAAAGQPAGVVQTQPVAVPAQVKPSPPISSPPPSPLQSNKLPPVSKNSPMPCLPMKSGAIVGIAPFKGNTPPYGAFANTTQIVNGKGVYQVVQDKTMDGKQITIDGKPRTFTWPSSENAFHAQKLLAYKQTLESAQPPQPIRLKAIERMLLELETMPKNGDKFLPRVKGAPLHPDTYEGLVNRNLAELGFPDKNAFDKACKADYHPKFNPSGGINPDTKLPYTYDYMKFSVQLKLEQHPELKEMAKECARRGIMPVEISQYDQTWASFDGNGRNLLGIAILELGNQFLKAEDKIDGPIANPHAAYATLQKEHKSEISHKNVSKYVSGNKPDWLPDSIKPIAASTTSPVPVNTSGDHLFTVHSAPVFTPHNQAAAVVPRTPLIVDPRGQLKEIEQKIKAFTSKQMKECGLKEVDISKLDDKNNPTLRLGINCSQDQNEKIRNVYITPASADGGVVYSIEKSINPAENQKLLENAIRVAVEAATPGTVLSIPAGADKKSEEALMKAMNEIYGKDKYKVEDGKVTVPAERKKESTPILRAE